MARKPGVLRPEKVSCLQDYVMYIPLEWVDIQVHKESLLEPPYEVEKWGSPGWVQSSAYVEALSLWLQRANMNGQDCLASLGLSRKGWLQVWKKVKKVSG